MTGTLGKAVSLLEQVVMAKGPLRFTDILKLSTQPRGTLHRQLSHLVEEGLLEQRADQTYVAGIRLLKFAASAWSSNDLRTVAAPHLQGLFEETGESVHLGVVRGTEIIYLDKIDGRHAVRMHSQIGRASPLYCTGVGKAALSLLPQPQLIALVDTLSFRAFSPNTIVGADAFLAEIGRVRQRGFAFDLEEHETGIHCIAVPLAGLGSDVQAAISVTGPAYRLTRERLEEWVPILQGTAAKISQEASWRLAPAMR